MKEFNEFKKLKFQSVIPQDILQAVGLLEKLGYEAGSDFSTDDAAKHNGVCAWDDGEITEGWLDKYAGFEQVTLWELKGMVGENTNNEVLWLNKNTLEEKYLRARVFLRGIGWVKVPDGATFATGDRDNLVFRKDGFYYDNMCDSWNKSFVTLENISTYNALKLLWVKGEYLWGVSGNKFTLERLLGCEVLFDNESYCVKSIYYTQQIGHLVLENNSRRIYVSNFNHVTFFTEDGNELTFDEYVAMYYGD